MKLKAIEPKSLRDVLKIRRRGYKRENYTPLDIVSGILYWFFWAILILLALSMLILPAYMLVTSLKADNLECVLNPFGLPEKATWSNFREIFVIFNERLDVSIFDMLYVSIVTSVFKPIISTFFTAAFAYVEAKYDFVGRKFFFSLGIVVMILPIIGGLPSAMQVSKALGTYDNLWANILTSTGAAAFSGTNFLLMYGAFKSIPWDYAEAAQIDGAGPYRIFFNLYLRMALPQAVVLIVMGFMSTWNDYSTYLIWLPSTPNISYGMYLFNQRATSFRVSLPELMAGFTVVMIPTVIIYLCTQKIITSKFAVGGLKG